MLPESCGNAVTGSTFTSWPHGHKGLNSGHGGNVSINMRSQVNSSKMVCGDFLGSKGNQCGICHITH